MSVISNPAAAEMIVLDHAKKTAVVQPAPPPPPTAPATPAMPQMPKLAIPGMPQAPHLPPVQVEDLGKRLLNGHEVQGKKFVIPPMPKPPVPPALAAPKLPKMSRLPGMPPVPKAPTVQPPGAPKAPQPPATAEVWTSTSAGVPMLTKVNSSFGQMTQVCKKLAGSEPHPSAFQIPQGYKVTKPSVPTPPKVNVPKLPFPTK